jgi:putative Mg2+ transporter-C (MgtC) family protein
VELLSQARVVVTLLIAVILGGLIGFERELAGKPAGLRTHMLVAISSALLVTLGNVIVVQFTVPDHMRSDPIRIIEAVIVGISFLGAGTIMQREERGYVEGLTTAASILAAAAVGIAVALHLMVISVGTTLLILIINRVMSLLERWMRRHLRDAG